ncbi:MAG: TonB-dependent receptor [Balneolaceae bacterium]|nr:TonB-dependent receptor [Balneolaceae bacterium]
MSFQANAQDRTVSGTVTSAANGEPLAGVSVVVQGTTIGIATNQEGEYSLSVPEGNNTLVFSFVGFVTQEVPVNDRTEINVELQTDIQQLSDVVVVGYGSQIKRDLTGNIASVSGEDIAEIPVNSFESAIQGRAAGVFINAGNGKLGQGISVRIRGTSSISASAEPLYVIDGIPVTSASLSSFDNETNPLATLNTSNIESIDVLKDASATAIYGSRGSNGVVLITTKRGRAGGTQVNVNYQTSFSEPATNRDFMRSSEYINYFLEAAENRAVYDYNRRGNPDGYASEQAAINDWVSYTESVFDFYGQGVDWRNNPIDFDWQNQAYQDAYGQEVDASVSAGNEQTRFFVSGAYSNQNGILIDNEYTRINGRINVDHDASEKFKVGLNLSVNRTINNRLGNDNLFETPMQMVAQIPFSPIFEDDPDASGYQATNEYNINTYYYNALDITNNSTFKTKLNRTFGNVYAEYAFNPNLFVRSEFGTDILNQNEAYHYDNELSYYTGSEGTAYSAFTEALNYTTNSYLNYRNIFAQDHNIEAIAGISANVYKQDYTEVQGDNFPNSSFTQIQNAADIVLGSGSETEYSFLSYFTRANYKYKDRYLLGLSARMDGSSRFGENNRYGFFPSVSAGWIISDEEFMSDASTVSFLKLRASYGKTGNANIGNFPGLGLYAGVSYAGASALQPSQTPNPDLKWETTTQLDVGLDFGLFDDRITGELDYYIKNTEDLLLGVNVPGTTGFTTQTRNVGKLTNQGVEFVLNTRNISAGDFLWTSSFNIAANRNEVGDINGQVIEGGYINRAVEGEPIGVFYSYEYAGVDPETGDALFYVNDVGEDGFGVVDHSTGTTNDPSQANQVVIGNPNPDFIGGLNNSFSYKGFDLSVLFQFVVGNDIYNGGGVYMSSGASYFDNQTADQLDRWQNSGDETDVPEPRLGLGNGNVNSSRYLSDGSYLRLKTLTFAYNLPAELLSKANIRSARLFVTGSNLLTFTNYEGWDPEVTADYLDGNLALGNDFYSAPQPRTFAIGINLGL